MAKILDNIAARFLEWRLTKAHQSVEWIKTELKELPVMEEQKVSKKLGRKLNRLNRKLAKSAFKACDKQEYISYEQNRKLKKYDKILYMGYRAANHGTAKAIFKAINKGESYEAVLEQHKPKIEKLRQKRGQYIEKLNAKSQRFLDKNSLSDRTEYENLSAESDKYYAEYELEIREKSAQRQEKHSQRLIAKLDKYTQTAENYKSQIKSDITLPEDVLLRVENLKMYFGGLKAVDDLTFDVKKGEIFGLIGPNGAGKTTVFNCITRFYDATGGNMYFYNKQEEVVDLRRFKVHDIILQGISRTFQNVELVKEISVLDNLLVACTRNYRSNLLVQALGLPSLKKEDNILKAKAMRILEFMGLESYALWPAFGLPYGILKKVEIARALMSDAKLIIMDEPAAGLNDTETAELAETIKKIRDEFNATILLVEHDMKLVMGICDTICAISFGKMLAIGSRDEILNNKAVQEAYLGVAEEEQ